MAIIENNNKILVFSQFTSVLKKYRRRINRKKYKIFIFRWIVQMLRKNEDW